MTQQAGKTGGYTVKRIVTKEDAWEAAKQEAAELIKKTAAETDFREDELAPQIHWNKDEGRYSVSVFPMIGGRMRLAHEDHKDLDGKLSMETEVVKEAEGFVRARAVATTRKGRFTAYGNWDYSRGSDKFLSTTRVEVAETRALARALERAGYGTGYRSAEEMVGLDPLPDREIEDPEPSPEQEARASAVARAAAGLKEAPRGNGKPAPAAKATPAAVEVPRTGNKCATCDKTVSASVATLSMRRAGKVYCTTHLPAASSPAVEASS